MSSTTPVKVSSSPSPEPPELAQRAARVLASLPDAILLIDRHWRITYMNAAARALAPAQLQATTDAIATDATLWTLFPQLQDNAIAESLRRVMEGGPVQQFEHLLRAHELWFDVRVYPDAEGIAVYCQDTTAKHELAAREEASTRRALQIYETMPDAIVLVDFDYRFTFANQRAIDILGTPDFLGQNIFERFPGNRQDPYRAAYTTAMEQRIATQFEAYHGDPLFRWFKVLAQPYEGGIIVYFSDVSARKEVELREKATAAQLAQVLEVTSDGVVSLDRDWRIRYLNPKGRQMVDPEYRSLGAVHWDAFPASRTSQVWENYHRTMNERVPTAFETYYPAPLNGWYLIRTAPSEMGMVAFFRDVTDERAQARELERQQERLADIQQTAKVAAWEVDPEAGDITYSPGSYPIFGVPLDQVSRIADLMPLLLPGHDERLRTAFAEGMRSGQVFTTEFALFAPDGSTLWIESRGQAATAADGKRVLRGAAIDITKRKADEAELVASEARYRVLAELNPQAIWMADAAGAITYANQGLLTYMGVEFSSMGELRWLQNIKPEDRERVLDVWSQCLATGEPYDVETRLRHAATGDWRWWHLRAAPVRDSENRILYWLGVGLDIHELKTNAELLRSKQVEAERQHAELESIYRTTPVGLALLDPVEFSFLKLNDREAEILGMPREQVLGKPLREIAPIPGLIETFQTVAQGASVRNRLVEGELPTRPGERRAWSVNYSPLYDETGQVHAISTASIEITDQRRAEAALIQSEKLAAVGRLASSISHEINNPLEAITNLLYIIACDEKLPPDLRTYVSTAQAELGRVSQIVTQTLRFHRQAVAPTLVSPAELVGAVLRLYTGRLANSNVLVDARYTTETRIRCFENDVRQVLNNLIANAIDAMRGGGRLIIRAHEATALSPLPGDGADGEPRRGVRITIADTGHGMSAQVRARVFEPFYTTKDLNGTGLGLWISLGIVERHQGQLRVRSNDDAQKHYTAFSLFLPCEEH